MRVELEDVADSLRPVVVKLDKARFDGLLALSPQVSLSLTRQVIQRLQTQNLRRPLPAPVTIAVLPVTAGVAAASSRRYCRAMKPPYTR